MLEIEVKLGEIEQPMGLSVIKIAWLVKVGQVFVIHENLNRGGRAKEVVAPSIKCTHDC